MGRSFTRADLEAKTAKELKRMCVDELGIVGVTKKPKDDVINAILEAGIIKKPAEFTVIFGEGKCPSRQPFIYFLLGIKNLA